MKSEEVMNEEVTNEEVTNEEAINEEAINKETVNIGFPLMKVPSVEQIRQCEEHSITHKLISATKLMENAATACVNLLKQRFSPSASMLAFCGMGNNGGDGLAIVRILHENGFDCQAYIVTSREIYSRECNHQLHLLEERNIEVKKITQEEDIPSCKRYDVVIDALLGIGLNSPIEDPLLQAVIKRINKSKSFVFAVDTPSGLYSDQPMEDQQLAVEADFTLSFQFPKLGFFFPENYRYVGEWAIADINLRNRFARNMQSTNYMIEHRTVKALIRPRRKFVHKRNFGYGLLIAGNSGMIGAAVLAARAALRTGIGLLMVTVPIIGYDILLSAVNEAICRCDKNKYHFTGTDFGSLVNFNAIAIGCGLGTHPDTANGLKKLIGDFGGTIIFDADAINILANNKTWLEFIPPNCIFTPHLKEFERLTQKVNNSYERLELQRQFSIRHRCVVVLKGAHTSISTPQGEICFNTSGNPGMAKGGSGDVLTGMLLALAAQGYDAVHAAIIGVYLHGLAADKALDKQSCESLLPSDIIENIGQGYKSLLENS